MNNESQLVVTNSEGRERHNLWGVFRRVFPVAMHNVAVTGQRQPVDYYGQTYTISLRTQQAA